MATPSPPAYIPIVADLLYSKMSVSPRAVVLLSGGLDSATVLAMAKAEGYECYALTVDYGQRSIAELEAAKRVAGVVGVSEHFFCRVDADFWASSSALTSTTAVLPQSVEAGIPTTYVAGRNTVLLALAQSWAEMLQAGRVFIGVNSVDYSGYPDCRADFIQAFQEVANVATKIAVEGQPIAICAPLLHMNKAEIITAGLSLGVDYKLTVSCYQSDSDGRACGTCVSCQLRASAFSAAGVTDVTRYRVA